MSRRVAIVGGGVVGLCVARSCCDRGWSVTLIDRGRSVRDGCSFGNAGMIVPSHFVPLAAPGMIALGLKWMWNPESPFAIQPRLAWDLARWGWEFWRAATRTRVERAAPVLRDLNLRSREAYIQLSERFGESFSLTQRGLIMLCRTEAAYDEEAKFAERAKRLGVPADVVDAAGAAALDPTVRMDVRGGVYFPLDCHLSPQLFIDQLERSLERDGVRFLWGAESLGFEREGSRLRAVQTTRGPLEADEFVIAGGAWSTDLGRTIDLDLPMQAGKGYSLTLERPRQLPQLCSILTEARVAVTPMNGTLRFGGTMEIGGIDDRIRPARLRGIIKSAVRYFPEFRADDFEGIAPWQGLRPCSPDGLPYVGRSRRWSNAAVATGHAMMGLSLAPVTGQLIAELLDGRPASIPLELLSPDRFDRRLARC